MIKSLTPEQIKLAEQIRDEWIGRLGNMTLDREKAAKGINFMYKEAGLSLPKRIIYMVSPLSMQYAYHVLNELPEEALEWDNLQEHIEEKVAALLAVNAKVKYQSMSCKGSVLDWYWVAFSDFFQRIGVELTDKFNTFRDYCCLSGAYDYLLYDKVAIVCEHPIHISWEQMTDRLIVSDREKAAIRWRDGFSIYKIDNILVPEKVVLDPKSLTIEEIQSETNMELQRIMIEQYGTGEYVSQLDAKVIDVDMRGVEGGGARALLQIPNGDQWLVATDGSTNRVYYMAVRDCKTCKEAHFQISGIDESLIKLEG